MALDALLLERLQSNDAEKFKLGIQCMPSAALLDEIAMAAALRALSNQDSDVRFLAAYKFFCAGDVGVDITPALTALEQLFSDDQVPPMHQDYRDNMWLTASANAIRAVGQFHARRENVAALWALLAENGKRGVIAHSCLSAAPNLTPYLDILHSAMNEGEATPSDLDQQRRRVAASAVAGMHWRKQEWLALEALLFAADEIVRLAAFDVLDRAAEKDGNLTAVLPAILRTFEHTEPAFLETRHAAARVLLWQVHGKKARVLLLKGVDILKIPELREERKAFRRFAKKLARDK